MRYALLFSLLSMVLIANAVLQGGWGLLLLWPGLSFLLVAVAYAGLGPAVFGKQPDGTLAPARAVLLLPYLLLSLSLWHLVRLLSREPCAEALLRKARPGVRLTRGQRVALDTIAQRQQATV